MRYKHISKQYISAYGTFYTLSELEKIFAEFREIRPAIYTDFFVWLRNMIGTNLLYPV